MRRSLYSVYKAFDELRAYWDRLLGIFSLDSGDERLDRMVNIWNQYQCMITFCFSRSASFFESGIGRGMGFRDSNQDLVGFVHQIPERARQRIIDIASAGLLDICYSTEYQPHGVIIESTADVIVATLCQRLILMIASAVGELCRRDVDNALTRTRPIARRHVSMP